MTDIRIKVLTKKDNLQQIIDLFNNLYPQRPIKEDYILWRYLDNPSKSITYIAKDKDKIIGSYSGCVFKGLVKRKQGKIGLLYDLMVNPKYQNRGLALSLYTSILEFMIKQKPNFLYCFVNPRLLPLYTKYLKWELLKEISLYSNQTQKIKRNLSNLDLELNKIKYDFDITNSISRLTKKSFEDENIATFILRSKKILLWRSKQIYGKNFKLYFFKKQDRLVGFCLLKFFEDKVSNKTVVDLIDIVAYPKHYIYSILYIVCTIIEQSDIYDITTFGFGQVQKKELIKLGFKELNIKWNLLALNMQNSVDPNFYVNMLDAEMF